MSWSVPDKAPWEAKPEDDPGRRYPPGYTDELADRLTTAAEALHVREIDDPAAYLGQGIAVADLMRDLDETLRAGAPLPKRWTTSRDH